MAATIIFSIILYCDDFIYALVSARVRTITLPAAIALGLSVQSESFVLLDRNGKPLRKAISWLDQRSEEEVDEIRSIINE